MKISKNFTLKEFEKSQAALRLGISNSIPQELIPSITALATNVLQPVRDAFGPVIITSGYRSPELNTAIGGSIKSQHSKAEAADFEVIGFSNLEVAEWLFTKNFDQLILEFYEPGDPNSGWIHVSYSETNRNEALTAYKENGRTVYKRGLGT